MPPNSLKSSKTKSTRTYILIHSGIAIINHQAYEIQDGTIKTVIRQLQRHHERLRSKQP